MLELNQFTVTVEGMQYFGANHYTITDEGGYFAVHVETLDDNGNAVPAGSYAASTLSTAIATIEALERGEEI